jgi:hypothetical protein
MLFERQRTERIARVMVNWIFGFSVGLRLIVPSISHSETVPERTARLTKEATSITMQSAKERIFSSIFIDGQPALREDSTLVTPSWIVRVNSNAEWGEELYAMGFRKYVLTNGSSYWILTPGEKGFVGGNVGPLIYSSLPPADNSLARANAAAAGKLKEEWQKSLKEWRASVNSQENAGSAPARSDTVDQREKRVVDEDSRRSRIALSLGLHSGQSQVHVKTILAAHGYQGLNGSGLWACFPNGLVNGEDTVACGSRSNQVAKLVIVFGMAKIYRDPDTTEFHRVPTDRLLVAYFEFAESNFFRSSTLNFYSAGLKKCNGVNRDAGEYLNF